jgi:hypothetical protein
MSASSLQGVRLTGGQLQPHTSGAAVRAASLRLRSTRAVACATRHSLRASFSRHRVVVCASSDWPAADSGSARPSREVADRQRSALGRLAAAASEAPEVAPTDAPLTPAARIRALALVAWNRVLRPLRDFGFGRRNIWEGGVGLFLLGGVGASYSHPLLRPRVPHLLHFT